MAQDQFTQYTDSPSFSYSNPIVLPELSRPPSSTSSSGFSSVTWWDELKSDFEQDYHHEVNNNNNNCMDFMNNITWEDYDESDAGFGVFHNENAFDFHLQDQEDTYFFQNMDLENNIDVFDCLNDAALEFVQHKDKQIIVITDDDPHQQQQEQPAVKIKNFHHNDQDNTIDVADYPNDASKFHQNKDEQIIVVADDHPHQQQEQQPVVNIKRNGSKDLAAMFLGWLKANKGVISAGDLRRVKLKRSTIESSIERFGGGERGMKRLLKLILEWVQKPHIPHEGNIKRAKSLGESSSSRIRPNAGLSPNFTAQNGTNGPNGTGFIVRSSSLTPQRPPRAVLPYAGVSATMANGTAGFSSLVGNTNNPVIDFSNPYQPTGTGFIVRSSSLTPQRPPRAVLPYAGVSATMANGTAGFSSLVGNTNNPVIDFSNPYQPTGTGFIVRSSRLTLQRPPHIVLPYADYPWSSPSQFAMPSPSKEARRSRMAKQKRDLPNHYEHNQIEHYHQAATSSRSTPAREEGYISTTSQASTSREECEDIPANFSQVYNYWS